jgi:hypothetical protein
MTIDEKKALIADFLARCNAYAEEKLTRYYKELPAATNERAAELRDKIRDWSAYRKFNEHAIAELDSDTLDSWFS